MKDEIYVHINTGSEDTYENWVDNISDEEFDLANEKLEEDGEEKAATKEELMGIYIDRGDFECL